MIIRKVALIIILFLMDKFNIEIEELYGSEYIIDRSRELRGF